MKSIFLGVLLIAGFNSSAQSLKLKPGQKITAVTIISGDIDMGMGKMTTYAHNTNLIEITGEKDNNYTLTNVIQKVKIDMEVMGKSVNFDSEKPEDKDSEIGANIHPMLNKTVSGVVNKTTARTELEKDPAAGASGNSMEQMMGSFGNAADPSVAGAFFVIPAGKKTGDSWAVKDSSAEGVGVKNYKILSIKDNVATISTDSDMNTSGTIDANGGQLEIITNTRSKGEILVNINTGMVIKNTTDADINANIEMMGQSMPVTGKNKIISEYKADN